MNNNDTVISNDKFYLYFSFLGLDGQLSLTTHQLDEDIDDCRVLVESEDLNEIVSELMRYS